MKQLTETWGCKKENDWQQPAVTYCKTIELFWSQLRNSCIRRRSSSNNSDHFCLSVLEGNAFKNTEHSQGGFSQKWRCMMSCLVSADSAGLFSPLQWQLVVRCDWVTVPSHTHTWAGHTTLSGHSSLPDQTHSGLQFRKQWGKVTALMFSSQSYNHRLIDNWWLVI